MNESSLKQKNSSLVLYIFILVSAMLALSFASVPLYDLFCRVTGYGGTTQKSTLAPGSRVNAGLFNVRFDANVSGDLNWKFSAPDKPITIQPGIQKIIYYTAENLSDNETIGTASFNVSPPKAGSIFMKVDCFCFVNQKLKPGEKIQMPVSFYIDPKIEDDKNLKDLNEITLSYTFFKVG